MKTSIKKRNALLVVGFTLATSLQFSMGSSWAADCGKPGNSKLAPCVSATAKPGPGSSMQTIEQGGAQAQKKASQGTVDTKTASMQNMPREKRTWVGQTVLTCKKGTVTLHMAAGATMCPDGFRKS
ncbi:hypothetical protein MCEMRE22_01018 [Candidatus Nanopelagicaceae bacterium]